MSCRHSTFKPGSGKPWKVYKLEYIIMNSTKKSMAVIFRMYSEKDQSQKNRENVLIVIEKN